MNKDFLNNQFKELMMEVMMKVKDSNICKNNDLITELQRELSKFLLEKN